MRLLCNCALFFHFVALVVGKVYTGFNYGAFWTGANNVAKTKEDFARQFNLAKSLPNVPVLFDSARLFTCVQYGTTKAPIEAFEAAIETNTSLLLGLWNPGSDDAFENELTALETALQTYGSRLADLVVGISVGNEDVFRESSNCNASSTDCTQNATAEVVSQKIAGLRAMFQTSYSGPHSTIATPFKTPPPIGHADIAKYAPVNNTQFIGSNIYPYWDMDDVADASTTLKDTLNDIQSRSNGVEIWITETGWPFAGDSSGKAIAGVDNLQSYWSEVGCNLFGKVNTWWFELESDTTDGDGLDWAILDSSGNLRLKDISCPHIAGTNSSLLSATAPTSSVPIVPLLSATSVHIAQVSTTTSSSLPDLGLSSVTLSSIVDTILTVPRPGIFSSTKDLAASLTTVPSIRSTTTTTVTLFSQGPLPFSKTVSAAPFIGHTPNARTTLSLTTVTVTETDCVTVAIIPPGALEVIATNSAGQDGTCSSPPPYMPPPSSSTISAVSNRSQVGNSSEPSELSSAVPGQTNVPIVVFTTVTDYSTSTLKNFSTTTSLSSVFLPETYVSSIPLKSSTQLQGLPLLPTTVAVSSTSLGTPAAPAPQVATVSSMLDTFEFPLPKSSFSSASTMTPSDTLVTTSTPPPSSDTASSSISPENIEPISNIPNMPALWSMLSWSWYTSPSATDPPQAPTSSISTNTLQSNAPGPTSTVEFDTPLPVGEGHIKQATPRDLVFENAAARP